MQKYQFFNTTEIIKIVSTQRKIILNTTEKIIKKFNDNSTMERYINATENILLK